MAFIEAIALSIVEFFGYLASLVLGRAFNLNPKKASDFAAYLLMAVVTVVLVAITVIFS